MTEKERINQRTIQSCLPNARTVYVRHCNEEVLLLAGESPWGGLCHLIHPEVTLKEFFA